MLPEFPIEWFEPLSPARILLRSGHPYSLAVIAALLWSPLKVRQAIFTADDRWRRWPLFRQPGLGSSWVVLVYFWGFLTVTSDITYLANNSPFARSFYGFSVAGFVAKGVMSIVGLTVLAAIILGTLLVVARILRTTALPLSGTFGAAVTIVTVAAIWFLNTLGVVLSSTMWPQ